MSEMEDQNLRPAIPEDWRIMPLASVSIGGAHNGYFKKPELVGEGYKLINVSELYQSFGIDTDHAKVERVRASIVDYSRYGVHDGDIFFTRSSLVLSGIAACNVLRKVKEPTLFECHVMRIVPDRKQVDSDFVAYCCRDSFSRSYLMSRAKQTTMTTISQPEIEQLPIPLPPLPQQRKIARILTTLDNVITQTEALIAKYQAIKQGLMHDLFTRGVDATGKLRPPQSEAPKLYKQSELGWIPKEWEVRTLDSAAERVIVGLALSVTQAYRDNGTPLIRNQNIRSGFFEDDEMLFLDPQFAGLFPNKRLVEGDVLTVRTGSNVGDTALAPAKYSGCLTFTTLITSPKKSVLFAPFMVAYLASSSCWRR